MIVRYLWMDPYLPTIRNDPATNITQTSANLNGYLTSTGTSATAVWVYWGPTDGTTNANQWANTNFFGTNTVGEIGYTTNTADTVPTLTPATAYYYNFYAQNASGGVWAATSGGSKSFTTYGPPTVAVSNATVGAGTATLNGRLISTNGSPTTFFFCWSTNDHGTNATTPWTVLDCGPATNGQSFSTNLSSLTYGIQYWYRAYATNAYGVAWSSPTNFLTAVPGAVATGGNYTSLSGAYRIHVFTNSATASNFVVTVGGKCEVLVVGGGGGGGGRVGGGGGGGGLVWAPNYSIAAGSNYTVTVGDGGNYGTGQTQAGSNGFASYFGQGGGAGVEIKALGGGGGASYNGQAAGANGGSGGGGAYSATNAGTANQPAYTTASGPAGATGYGSTGGVGYASGSPFSAGGGGGAGQTGFPATATIGGNGGNGMQFTQFAGLIPSTVGTPSDGYFAGGGGGGATGTEGTTCGSGGLGGGGNGLFGGSTAGTGTASNGLANTGGGGGGAPDNNNTGHGGKGGSGIVIVRYINPAIGLVNSNATPVTATSAVFNATLTLTGSNSTWDVYAYWGPADGTNNPSAWSNTAFAGTYTLNTTSTNIAYPASSGIVAGTTYYTFFATNAATNLWASPSTNFLSLAPPTVAVSNATGIGIGTATLNAWLVTQSADAMVICWGTNDCGISSTGAWPNVVNFGPKTGPVSVSTNLSGLTYGQQYWYRAFATNSTGGAWSPTATNFVTAFAAGGTKTSYTDADGKTWIAHTFKTVGATSITFAAAGTVQAMVVAGGGAGGFGAGGGGGAGGVIVTSSYAVVAGATNIVVGAGGAGTNGGSWNVGSSGQNSVFGSLTGYGGGGGSSQQSTAKAGSGGSSGAGGGWSGGTTAAGDCTNTQGNVGGNNAGQTSAPYPSGGGGGAGGQGQSAPSSSACGAGGIGITNSFETGAYQQYGGGGGGGLYTTPGTAGGASYGGGTGGVATAVAGNGSPNTGGGGGGCGNGGTSGNGGSGIVIVRYAVLGSPRVANAAATNIMLTSANFNGSLTDDGGDPATVKLLYGPADGGTNWATSTWAYTNDFPGTYTNGASLTTNITGLSSNTCYYYRYYATNSGGDKWASPVSVFMTGEIGVQKTADASEVGLVPGTFTFTRNSSVTNEAVTVNFTVSGTAKAGTNYVNNLGTNIVIPAGASSTNLTVTPLLDDTKLYATTVTVTLATGAYASSAGSADLVISNSSLPNGTWTGGAGDGKASTAGNWAGGVLPTAASAISLRGDISSSNMTWDAGATNIVASWSQNATYAGTVTVATVYPGKGAFTNFTITGDCAIQGGTWTHSANTTTANGESNRLCVTVNGNLLVTNSAKISAENCGYAIGEGPGKPSGSGNQPGAAHGGGTFRGPSNGGSNTTNLNTYGSVISPISLGSGGSTTIGGGGAIVLTVAGTTTVSSASMISASAWGSVWQSAGAGGSVKLRTGWLTGSGTIRANGAWSDSSNYGGAGGGGRIAIVLTGGDFSTWTGTNMARSTAGSGQSADSYGAAGTVYRQAAGVPDGAGIVFVDNGAIATNASFTSLPALSNQTENLAASAWVVTNTTRLGLTTNCTIASLNLSSANSTLELGGWTLTVGALTVTNTVYSTGTYTPSEISRLTDAVGGGKVVVSASAAGTMFLFR